MLFFFKPKIAVDGQEMPVAGWGRTVLPARPGQHQVNVSRAVLPAPEVGSGRHARRMCVQGSSPSSSTRHPLWSFSAGSLGVGPQKYNGVGITIAIVAIPFAILFLVIVLLNPLAAI